MKPDTELDKRLWQRETTKQLRAALQLGFPSCPLQVLAVFMAFANAMALRLYQFEQKTTHWVSPNLCLHLRPEDQHDKSPESEER